MHQLTINVGFGFFFGLLLCASAVVIATLLLARRVLAHIQDRDLSADRKTATDAVAGVVADCIAHPRVVDALSATISTGINRWITSSESQEAIRQVYAKAPRSEAVREIGKEVPTYVKNFGLGVVDAFTLRGDKTGGSSSNGKDLKNGGVRLDHTNGDMHVGSKKGKTNDDVHPKEE